MKVKLCCVVILAAIIFGVSNGAPLNSKEEDAKKLTENGSNKIQDYNDKLVADTMELEEEEVNAFSTLTEPFLKKLQTFVDIARNASLYAKTNFKDEELNNILNKLKKGADELILGKGQYWNSIGAATNLDKLAANKNIEGYKNKSIELSSNDLEAMKYNWNEWSGKSERRAITNFTVLVNSTKDAANFTEINTPDKLEYIFYQAYRDGLTFRIRAARDAQLALTSGPHESDQVFEILLGARHNTISVIRKNCSKPHAVGVDTPQILSAGEFRGFWVRWHDNVINVGREGEDAAFMSWEEPGMAPVRYVGICTGWGANGTWLFDKDQSSDTVLGFSTPSGSDPGFSVPTAKISVPPVSVDGHGEHISEINTPDKLEYIFYPAYRDGLTFRVRSTKDAHLALTSGPYESDPMFEIFLGGWSNTKSVIRKNRTKPDVVELKTPEILSAGAFRGFWIRWNDNVINVGREGENAAFMSWKEPSMAPVRYVGICTGWGANGTWLIDEDQSSGTVLGGSNQGFSVPAANSSVPPVAVDGHLEYISELNTPDKLEYIFYPAYRDGFTFRVRSAKDAHLALTSGPHESDPMFEIFLGGWSNTKSVIRKNRTKPDVVEVNTPEILSAGEFRGFWFRWHDNVINVGREGEDAAFMSWEEPGMAPVRYVGICTGWGANGTWLIDEDQSSDTVLGFSAPSGSDPGFSVPTAKNFVLPVSVDGHLGHISGSNIPSNTI